MSHRTSIFCAILLAAHATIGEARAAVAAPVTAEQARAALAAKFSTSTIATLQTVAAGDSAEAMTWLGRSYANGQGVARDQVQAVRWYRRAADLGFPLAQVELAWIYECGCGVAESRDEAMRWMQRAADQDYPPALFGLGWLHTYHKTPPGESILGDYVQAAEWLAKAADKGNGQAAYMIGEFYAYGKLERNSAEADRWFKRAAQLGYGEGRDHAFDSFTAAVRNRIEDLRPAADLGSPAAAFAIGAELIRLPDGSSQSAEALRWLRLAADRGHLEALITLAEYYDYSPERFEFNKGPVNMEERIRALSLRHATGALQLHDIAEAQRLRAQAGARLFQIAREFHQGERLPKNLQHAAELARRAAELGNADAENLLGELWQSGAAGVPDAKEALRWFRRAAIKGSRDGQFNLSRAILRGEGAVTNDFQAAVWLTIAAERGHAGARAELAGTHARLTPDLATEVKRRVDVFLGRTPVGSK